MKLIHISSLNDSGIEPFCKLTEAQLRNRSHAEEGLFIAESPKVINVALNAGYQPVSLLCEQRHIEGDAKDIIARVPDITVYTGSRELLQQLTGYKLTRGVLCAMRRPKLPSVEQICKSASRVCVIHGVVDTTNIGAIFRSAAALGIDAILVTSDSCDPLNRRAVRVSMGSVFLVPWTYIESDMHSLSALGFKTVAMALTDQSLPIDSEELCQLPKMALVMGTEGDGLPRQVIASCDYVARIPMSHQVDSLNVAAASAVAFWQLRKRV